MARRSLGKLDRSIDVSRYLRAVEDFPKPIDIKSLTDLFGEVKPLELEIGCGKGMFLRQAAVASPDRQFIGVEIGAKYARFCAIALARQQSTNAIIAHGDGVALLRDHLLPESLAAIHVYFPDPWWKRAHRKRRVLREETLRLIENRLQPQGQFHFRTDVREYFETTLDLMRRVTPLLSASHYQETPDEPSAYLTHFERRTLLHGEPVYRIIFQKNTAPIS